MKKLFILALLSTYPIACMDKIFNDIMRSFPQEMQKSPAVRYQVGLIMARFILECRSLSVMQSNLFLQKRLLAIKSKIPLMAIKSKIALIIKSKKPPIHENQSVKQAIRRRIAHYYKKERKNEDSNKGELYYFYNE